MSQFYTRIFFVLFLSLQTIYFKGRKKKEKRERGDREAKGSSEGPSKRVMATVVEQCYLLDISRDRHGPMGNIDQEIFTSKIIRVNIFCGVKFLWLVSTAKLF